MLNWLRNLFSPHAVEVDEAYARGKQFAWDELRKIPPGEDEMPTVTKLLCMADGAFNSTEAEDAFDRGIREVCYAIEQDLGAP